MRKYKEPLVFALCLIPIAAIGGWFTGIYAFNTYSDEMQAQILSEAGSISTLGLVSVA